VETGVKHCNLSPNSNPCDFFSLIFSEDLIKNLMSWTNIKAQTKIDNSKRRRQSKVLWKDVSFGEMKGFIGSLLIMGIVRMPNYRMYWEKETRLFSIPGISQIIKEQRFKDLYSCLYLRDSTLQEENKLAKIESFTTTILTNSLHYYLPSQCLSVDELMISFSGRSKMKVFMPQKPIKIGLKAYLLCESKTGYVLNWMLHSGEIDNIENSVTYKIVIL